ncbi:MAG: molybdate ABC transporter substrate-binding protein [Paracoccus sp. (in: a-proteobacteria)]|uniref:molybdate ABC transporter substrate-binding protein n=1 Tax=Paracoccus sp. TaxID=267 RepID=UPI0026E057CE|nr:molybdate ABC transporter substrate-binding protein [Paracoccus sp. (in: a-proteobacteria)]MDO5620390.1 molybdate ABC transporter substrate-binding protein [Paracoccus sp. (in: a-proteobacteria)]
MSRLATLALCAAFATPVAAEDVVVFAAASMKTALDPIAEQFQQATGNTVTISYAGSNALARQILEGAPADIFISASEQWMDEVQKAGEVADGSRVDLLGNTLVLVAHDPQAVPVDLTPDTDLTALLQGGKLAMALVDSVPAGQYGKEALTHLGLWDSLSPEVAQADNVRAALALVGTGEAPYGIVYATDAAADPNVQIVGTFPADSHAPITYPAALLVNAGDAADTAFFEALRSPEASAVFREQGFAILTE